MNNKTETVGGSLKFDANYDIIFESVVTNPEKYFPLIGTKLVVTECSCDPYGALGMHRIALRIRQMPDTESFLYEWAGNKVQKSNSKKISKIKKKKTAKKTKSRKRSVARGKR